MRVRVGGCEYKGAEDKKVLADQEKTKGNEAIQSNDYAEAEKYYSKSIEYNP